MSLERLELTPEQEARARKQLATHSGPRKTRQHVGAALDELEDALRTAEWVRKWEAGDVVVDWTPGTGLLWVAVPPGLRRAEH